MSADQIAAPVISVVAIVAVFGVSALSIWLDARKRERELLYRTELMKKLADSPPSAAEPVLALLHEEEERKRRAKREGLILAGLICSVVGAVALVIPLGPSVDRTAGMFGLVPLAVGGALILHALVFTRGGAKRASQNPK